MSLPLNSFALPVKEPAAPLTCAFVSFHFTHDADHLFQALFNVKPPVFGVWLCVLADHLFREGCKDSSGVIRYCDAGG